MPAVVVLVAKGPVAMTVFEMVAVTESPIQVAVAECSLSLIRSCLQSWWQLLKALCRDGVCAGCRHGISCQGGRVRDARAETVVFAVVVVVAYGLTGQGG